MFFALLVKGIEAETAEQWTNAHLNYHSLTVQLQPEPEVWIVLLVNNTLMHSTS